MRTTVFEKTAISECLCVPLALGPEGRRRVGEVKEDEMGV